MLTVLQSDRARDGACSGKCSSCSRTTRTQGDAISASAARAVGHAQSMDTAIEDDLLEMVMRGSLVTQGDSSTVFARLSGGGGPQSDANTGRSGLFHKSNGRGV
jgi:hypothetical protein